MSPDIIELLKKLEEKDKEKGQFRKSLNSFSKLAKMIEEKKEINK